MNKDHELAERRANEYQEHIAPLVDALMSECAKRDIALIVNAVLCETSTGYFNAFSILDGPDGTRPSCHVLAAALLRRDPRDLLAAKAIQQSAAAMSKAGGGNGPH